MADMQGAPPRPPGPRFDPTINLGHLLTMAGMLATMIAGWSQLSTRIEYVERQMTAMTTVIERGIKADARLEEIGRRLERLERENARAGP